MCLQVLIDKLGHLPRTDRPRRTKRHLSAELGNHQHVGVPDGGDQSETLTGVEAGIALV